MDGIILGIFAFLLKLIFVLIIVVPLYILCAVWETKILKACGYKNTWAAWVPFANMWALAEVSLGNQQFAPLYMANIQLPVMIYRVYSVIQFFVIVLNNLLIKKISPSILGNTLALVVDVLNLIFITLCFATIMQPFAYSKQMKFTETQSIVGGLIPIYGLYLIKKILVTPNNMYANDIFQDNQQYNNVNNNQNQSYEQNVDPGQVTLGNNQRSGLDGLGPKM